MHIHKATAQDDQLYFCLLLIQALECRYSGVEQALLLGWAMHIRKATAHDDLQAWQMAPYVEAVLTQRRSQYMLQVRLFAMRWHWKGEWRGDLGRGLAVKIKRKILNGSRAQ